jgi:hypothetical protein
MKIDKVRRLSVRVPAIGWEALISTERSEHTKAKIGNISADGAYLITKKQYQPDSRVTLSIKSSLIRFSSSAIVVRNDPYGMAVRFLDHSESTRRSLLRAISRSLLVSRSKRSFAEETSVCSKSQLKSNFDLEKVCLENNELSSVARCSKDSSLAERNNNVTGNNRLVISSAQTHKAKALKVFLNRCGKTTVKCPFCEKCHHTTVPKHLHNQPSRAKCECGESFSVLFDSRRYYRKEVRLPGEYRDISGDKNLMTVTTLSLCGAGLEVGRKMLSLNSGETIQVNFLLNNNEKTWIKSEAVVRRVNGYEVGVEFTGMNDHQRKCLGFYLMC